jgi:hypothetical protein
MPRTVSFQPSDESAEWPDDAPVISSDEQRKIYLGRAKSGYTKVRHSFIQDFGVGTGGSKPGMLGNFGRNHRAAVLYLALLTNWPWLFREAEPLPSGAWIRFLSCDGGSALTWTEQSLSHAWKTLEALGLIERPRKGRLLDVQPRREDGKAAYSPPTGKDGDLYWVLPDDFWTKQLHGILSWPALSVLLILLKETNGRQVAELSVDRAMRYYGIGRTTAEKGLSELRDKHFLLDSTTRFVLDPDSGEGRRRTSMHRLMSPFSTTHREKLRGAASARMESRAKKRSQTEIAGDDQDDEPSSQPAA